MSNLRDALEFGLFAVACLVITVVIVATLSAGRL